MTSFDEYLESKMKLVESWDGKGGTKTSGAKSGGKNPTWGNKAMGVVGI